MSKLVVNLAQLADFERAMFAHADEGTFLSLRAFFEDAGPDEKPFNITALKMNGDHAALVREIACRAQRAADYKRKVVFAPPVATFRTPESAKESNLACGVVLSVECDRAPAAARALLTGLLGPPTAVVASGGTWTDPETGEVQDKVHIHWRLSEPTRTREEHARLKRGRRLSTALVGGDTTNVPAVHPLRWPGSWHRKGAPRLTAFIELNEDAEIHLDDALEALEDAAAARRIELAEERPGDQDGDGEARAAAWDAGEPPPSVELTRRILAGEDYHHPLVALAWRHVDDGMTGAKVVETLRGIMLAVPEEARDVKDGTEQPGRWRARFESIPRLVRDAEEKLAGERTPEPGPEAAPAEDAEPPAGPRWPEPLDLALYGLPGDIVVALDKHTEADRAAVLVQFLVTFGVAVGRSPHMFVGRSRHGVNLYAAVVGASGKARKGTAWDDSIDVFQRADPRFVTTDHIAAGLSSGEGLIYAVRDRVTREVRKKGGGREIETVDEGVIDKRLLVIEGELGGTLKVMAREGNSLSAQLRSAWDGKSLRSLVKNSPMRATDPHIGVIGHITVDELVRCLDRTEMTNGFANRFLFVCAKRSKILPEPTSPEPRVTNDFVTRLKETLTVATRVSTMTRDAEARGLWIERYEALSEGRPGLAGGAANRGEAQVLRLSMLYALMDKSAVIARRHLEAALDLWRYCEESARFVFGDATGDPLADELMTALRDAGPDGLTRTEISGLFSRHKSGEVIDRTLSRLTALGRVSGETIRTGGRPSSRWRATR